MIWSILMLVFVALGIGCCVTGDLLAGFLAFLCAGIVAIGVYIPDEGC